MVKKRQSLLVKLLSRRHKANNHQHEQDPVAVTVQDNGIELQSSAGGSDHDVSDAENNPAFDDYHDENSAVIGNDDNKSKASVKKKETSKKHKKKNNNKKTISNTTDNLSCIDLSDKKKNVTIVMGDKKEYKYTIFELCHWSQYFEKELKDLKESEQHRIEFKDKNMTPANWELILRILDPFDLSTTINKDNVFDVLYWFQKLAARNGMFHCLLFLQEQIPQIYGELERALQVDGASDTASDSRSKSSIDSNNRNHKAEELSTLSNENLHFLLNTLHAVDTHVGLSEYQARCLLLLENIINTRCELLDDLCRQFVSKLFSKFSKPWRRQLWEMIKSLDPDMMMTDNASISVFQDVDSEEPSVVNGTMPELVLKKRFLLRQEELEQAKRDRAIVVANTPAAISAENAMKQIIEIISTAGHKCGEVGCPDLINPLILKNSSAIAALAKECLDQNDGTIQAPPLEWKPPVDSNNQEIALGDDLASVDSEPPPPPPPPDAMAPDCVASPQHTLATDDGNNNGNGKDRASPCDASNVESTMAVMSAGVDSHGNKNLSNPMAFSNKYNRNYYATDEPSTNPEADIEAELVSIADKARADAEADETNADKQQRPPSSASVSSKPKMIYAMKEDHCYTPTIKNAKKNNQYISNMDLMMMNGMETQLIESDAISLSSRSIRSNNSFRPHPSLLL